MANFWDFSVWGHFSIIAVLLISLLAANALKKSIKWLRFSLIPTSVLGGAILLILAAVYKGITGAVLFNEEFFGGDGIAFLENITYHALAIGFIASAFKSSDGKLTKKRKTEIFNTGVTTVSTYLLQAFVGLGITIITAYIVKDFFPAAGLLLPFGYGQGTGQALNYGSIYETDFGFEGGKSFGLTIAALGFLCASIGGVIHLNLLKKRNHTFAEKIKETKIYADEIQSDNEIPMNGSIDKLTVQVALIAVAYFLAYLLMYLLGMILPGMRSVIYGFNFLIGVLAGTLVRTALKSLTKSTLVKRQYINTFLMNRLGNCAFDIMIVAGIAAIRLDVLENNWIIILILGVAGLFITYFYNRKVAGLLFEEYKEEQFLAMYGMLTGTASTGVILLREIDGEFKSPASDNLVYQNFPAIIFGFPLMLLATLAPVQPVLTWIILVLFFGIMNVILFRSFIFKKKK